MKMKAYIAAMSFLTAALCGLANAQTGGPPGGTIEHVGPLSTTGQPSGQPLAQVPALTAAQRAAIFSSVTRDKTRSRGSENFNAGVGEQLPSTVALHPLPNGVLATAPAARPYRYTLLADQVVLVDPVTMRVVDVIKP